MTRRFWRLRGSSGFASVSDGGARAKLFARRGKTLSDAAGDQHRHAKARGLGGPAPVRARYGCTHADGRRHAVARVCRSNAESPRKNSQGNAAAEWPETGTGIDRGE